MKLFFLSIVLFVTGCNALTPHYNKKDYPCGTPTWHECPAPVVGMCCPQSFDCGGTLEFPGCPKDACCYNGEY